MDSSSGLPPEILVLCTTTETKEKAVRLWDWIRHIPDIQRKLLWEPAIPAICSLIASEQLGNTVVTERRAQQWSRSTPEQFKTTMGEVQKLLITSRMPNQQRKGRITIQALNDEFCPDQSALGSMLMTEKAFKESNKTLKWHNESDIVQLSIFIWSCRQFKIHTVKPVEDLHRCYNLSIQELKDIEDILDEHCLSPFSEASPTASCIMNKSPSYSHPPQTETSVPSVSPAAATASTPDAPLASGSSVRLEELAHEFGIGEDVMGGMRYLDKTLRESEELKDLVDWSSTMGRCVIFYWTCSVLKIPSAKHITLRTRYHLSKKEFDKILSTLDLQRGDLRKKLEAFYAGNPALHLLAESTQWAATSPAKPHYTSPIPVETFERSVSPGHRNGQKGTRKRGRPPKAKSPPPISLDPVSDQEQTLSTLCSGLTLRRALLLMRSFNAKRRPASNENRVPFESLPALIALVASQQLKDEHISEQKTSQMSHFTQRSFPITFAVVRASIDIYGREAADAFASQTTFDDLALEHGLGINTVVHMMHVREALKESRCLSVGMDWESHLVKCSVFFWTCAILKVPDVKQNLLRSRSLASKREFDSMLQLLNSHCTAIRHRLENEAEENSLIFAPPPSTPKPVTGGRPPFYGEQVLHLESRDGHSAKRIKGEALTPSDMGSDALGSRPSQPPPPRRKPGRPPKIRRLPQPDHSGDIGVRSGSRSGDTPIYVPTIQFPPADWKPPEPAAPVTDNNFTSPMCPPSETGESKRRHTRYSTLDYQEMYHERIEVWKPEGEEILKQQAQYRQWEERMALHYGPHWEKDIGHEKPGIPFE